MKIRKAFFYFTVLITLLVFFIACSENNGKNRHANNAVNHTKSVELSIEGMSCMACVAKVRNTLSDIEGVDDIHVSLERNNATFRYNLQKISLDKIMQAIHEIGYKAGTSKELSE